MHFVPPPPEAVSQVPFFDKNWVVVVPSNAIEVAFILDVAELSVITNLSPDATATLVVIVPPLVILPCVWEDGVLADV